MPNNNKNTSTSSVDGGKSALMARILSGSIGSVVTSLVVTPLEVVKVRMQAGVVVTGADVNNAVQRPQPPLSTNVAVPCPRGCGTFVMFNGHLDCVLPKKSVCFFDKYTGKVRPLPPPPASSQLGILAMVRRIFVQEGYAGIYAGLRPALVMAVPNTVLYFSAYDEIVWRLRNANGGGNYWAFPLLAGASARLVSSTATAPFELIRTRQAAAIGEDKATTGLWREFRGIIQAEGASALYRGLRPTLWRDVPFSSIYWLMLEEFHQYWRSVSVAPSPLEQAGQAFVSGAVAGMIAAACTTPFDVIKTRQQTSVNEIAEISVQFGSTDCKHNGAAAYEATSVKPGNGTFYLLRQVAHTEGIAGLWRGNQARMLKVAPGCAIMISSYEFGKRILE